MVEWHGHRGCRGLRPENSIPAFLLAIDLGMDALEMDVVISKDEQVVIAHEPYMPADICEHPDGSSISESEEKGLNLFTMNYEEIVSYNCGLKHPRFSEQLSEKVHRPTLSELFETAEGYTAEKEIPPISYTIELKCSEEYDKLYHPEPKRFVELVLEKVLRYGLAERCVLQSFDFRVLREIREQAPEISISMLLTHKFELTKTIEKLGFIPDIIGPRFQLLNKNLVHQCHEKGLRVVPWTINEVEDMERLIDMGVDGIITDYPDRKALIRG